MDWFWYIVVGLLIFVFLVLPTWIRVTLKERKAKKDQEKAKETGRHEPPSIRPWVDPAKCMGSGACVRACPEKNVIALIGGRVELVNGASCVGHGACAAACPVQAIELVFGSERRGIDLPDVSPEFESNVPGIYIAGELGGMGLIANAVEQGAQAATRAMTGLTKNDPNIVHVAVVGAGPAGLSAALTLHNRGHSYALLDQDEFGGAIRHYPRQKLVMTRNMDLAGYGKVRLKTARKEELIALFEDVVKATGLRVSNRERVDAIDRQRDGTFRLKTSRREIHAERVVLAIGRRGTPRRLGVPGEALEKVAYRLIDAAEYQDQHLLVVGGGDSAVEAAVALGEQPGNRVTLSYRKPTMNRPKAANLERLDAAVAAGQVTLALGTTVDRIDIDRVQLGGEGGEREIANDYVFVFAGGVLPTGFLKAAGIEIQTHHGKRVVRHESAPRA
jgi:thioredoxin reductase/Pyruvate/2-oxoacid:ferredoxin oxidoreductase delta subunit